MKRLNRKSITLGAKPEQASYAQKMIKGRLKDKEEVRLEAPESPLKKYYKDVDERRKPKPAAAKKKTKEDTPKKSLKLKKKIQPLGGGTKKHKEEHIEEEEFLTHRRRNEKTGKETHKASEREEDEGNTESGGEEGGLSENEGVLTPNLSNSIPDAGVLPSSLLNSTEDACPRNPNIIQYTGKELGNPTEISDLHNAITPIEDNKLSETDTKPLLSGRRKTFLPAAAPPRECSKCRFSLSCPKFEEGKECFYLPIFHQWTLETPFDIKEAILAMAEIELARAQEALIDEQLSGGVGTGQASDMLSKAKQALLEADAMFTPRERVQHNPNSIIAQLFGVNQFVSSPGEQMRVADGGSRREKQIVIADHDINDRDNSSSSAPTIDFFEEKVSTHHSEEENALKPLADIGENNKDSSIQDNTRTHVGSRDKSYTGIDLTEEETTLMQESLDLISQSQLLNKLDEEKYRREEMELKLQKMQKEKKEIPTITLGEVIKQ